MIGQVKAYHLNDLHYMAPLEHMLSQAGANVERTVEVIYWTVGRTLSRPCD